MHTNRKYPLFNLPKDKVTVNTCYPQTPLSLSHLSVSIKVNYVASGKGKAQEGNRNNLPKIAPASPWYLLLQFLLIQKQSTGCRRQRPSPACSALPPLPLHSFACVSPKFPWNELLVPVTELLYPFCQHILGKKANLPSGCLVP